MVPQPLPREIQDKITLEKGDIFMAAPGQILFFKVWGSYSHNTQTPTSDVDYLGVYRARTEEVLGIDRPMDTIVGEKPDFQLHEVWKFSSLLLKGNPGIVEMLFTDNLFWSSNDWAALKVHRKKFLTAQAVDQYLGYVRGQLKKHTKGSYLHTKGGQPNEKWSYHMMRLILDAERIIKGGEPTVWKSGDELTMLQEIRNGTRSAESVEKEVIKKLAELEPCKPWGLPEQAPKALLNDWLLTVREE